MLTVGSLFSGIGGLDLGLERAGMEVIWQSEIDPYACKVLAKHWPEVVNHGNIKEINWQEIERPDVICGGYPCQPFSTAGKRRGEEDPRHLWPWVRTAISELRPRYAILENVRGHLSMGGLSVIAELATIGYDAEWRVVSAASVGANHRRDRIIIVAYPSGEYGNGFNDYSRNSEQSEASTELGNGGGSQDVAYPSCIGQSLQVEWGQPSVTQFTSHGSTGRVANVAYPNNSRPHRAEVNATETGKYAQRGIRGRGTNVADTDFNGASDGRECETVPSQNRSGRNDRSGSGSDTGQIGLGSARENSSHVADTDLREIGWRDGWHGTGRSTVFGGEHQRRGTEGYEGWQWWQIEPDVGRVADGIPARVDRLRGLGNAVVPQVAEIIGRLVVAHAG